MAIFDIFILVVLAASLAWGFAAGFMRQLGTFAGLILAVAVCRVYGPQGVQWLAAMQGGSASATGTVLMAYAGMFVVVFVAVKLLAGLVRTIISALRLGFVDRLAGALLKAGICVFIVSVGLNFWTLLAPDSAPEGLSAKHVEAFAPKLVGIAASSIPEPNKE